MIFSHKFARTWAWAALGLFLISRIPFLFYYRELDLDESFQLAAAKRILAQPAPWFSVCTETSGYLNAGLLAALRLTGGRVHYQILHGISALAIIAIVACAWRTSQHLWGRIPALLGVGTSLLCAAACISSGFLHYASELLPAVLISAGVLSSVELVYTQRRPALLAAIAGLAFGAAPWAKLQSGPIALVAGGLLMGILIKQARAREQHASSIVILALGAVLPTAIIVCWSLSSGSFENMWHEYILENVQYAGHLTLLRSYHKLGYIRSFPPAISCFLLFLSAAIIGGKRQARVLLSMRWTMTFALAGVSLYCVVRPVTSHAHYWILMLAPLQLLISALFHQLLRASIVIPGKNRVIYQLGVLAVCVAAPAGLGGFENRQYFYQAISNQLVERDGDVRQNAVLRGIIPAGADVLVWGGWRPSLYSDLDAVPATRYVESFSSLWKKGRLLSEVKGRAPSWIVFVSCREAYPELMDIINKDYATVLSNNDMTVYRHCPALPRK